MMTANKWIYFLKVLSPGELLRLIVKRLSRRFGTNRASRTYILYQFIEECYKHKIKLVCEGRSILFKRFVNGVQIRFALRKFTSDPWVYTQVILKEEHETICKEIEKRKLPMEYMIDAGANIGLTTLYFKSSYPGLRVAAIEPDHDNLAQCQKNFELNQLYPVELIPKALWYKSTALQKDNQADHHLEWGYRFKEQSDFSDNTIMYDAVTIDDCVKQMRWPRIDYLKIDIEGAEKFLFSTEMSCQFLKKTSVVSIEAHSSETEDMIREMLEKFGFDVFKTGELLAGFKTF